MLETISQSLIHKNKERKRRREDENQERAMERCSLWWLCIVCMNSRVRFARPMLMPIKGIECAAAAAEPIIQSNQLKSKDNTEMGNKNYASLCMHSHVVRLELWKSASWTGSKTRYKTQNDISDPIHVYVQRLRSFPVSIAVHRKMLSLRSCTGENISNNKLRENAINCEFSLATCYWIIIIGWDPKQSLAQRQVKHTTNDAKRMAVRSMNEGEEADSLCAAKSIRFTCLLIGDSFVLKKMYNLCDFCHRCLEPSPLPPPYGARAIDKVFAFRDEKINVEDIDIIQNPIHSRSPTTISSMVRFMWMGKDAWRFPSPAPRRTLNWAKCAAVVVCVTPHVIRWLTADKVSQIRSWFIREEELL